MTQAQINRTEEEAERARREEEEREAAERQAQEEAERQEQEASERAALETAETAANAGKPKITLKKTAVVVPAGTSPAWTEMIAGLTDDKDGYETLFRNMTVSKYDRNTPGSYDVTLTTTDSDGNRSEPVQVVITVWQ